MITTAPIGHPTRTRPKETQMLTLTETAKAMVRDMVSSGDAPEGSGLRISAAHDEDGGPALSLELANEPTEGDEILEEDGTRLFLEPEAASLLDDKILDAERHDDHYHFRLDDQDDEGNGAA
jgi:iron-sulfur cluster assembly protein